MNSSKVIAEQVQGIVESLSMKERQDLAKHLEKLAREGSLSRFLDKEFDPVQMLYVLLSGAPTLEYQFRTDTYIALHGYLRSKSQPSEE